MANVSTWADSYRYTDNGGWSAPLHYIDANDDPPETCGVVYDRDCGEEGCVVSAIVNYTSILTRSTGESDELEDAIRFLIHFGKFSHFNRHFLWNVVGEADISGWF
jgi:hypothetical protein